MGKVSYKSTYSKSFFSTELNQVKYNELLSKATKIRNLKNLLSQVISNDILKYINFSKIDSIKYFLDYLKNNEPKSLVGLSGQDIQHAIADVHVSYENKFKQIRNKIQFKVQDKLHRTYYKNNGKSFKKGDLKNIELKKKSTPLTMTMSYLGKYGKERITDYVNKRIELNDFKDDNQKLFYQNIQKHISKFGEERLLKLALMKRNKVLKKYNHSIGFKSLTFSSLNQISTPILDFNKNYNSCINTFIMLDKYPGRNPKRLYIPVKFAKDKYHGPIKDYQKGRNTSYTVYFKDKNEVRIILSKPGERFVNVIDNCLDSTKVLGIDVNVKHNLFSTSDKTEIDYDRKLFDSYVKFLKKLDKAKTTKTKKSLSKEEISRISNRNKVKFDKWKLRIVNMLKNKCSQLVQDAKNEGKKHIVLEDLKLMAKSFTKNDEFEGFRYSRLIRMLNLTSLRHIIKGIAYRHGLTVSFVQAHYTSKACSKCGCISDENRKTQEKFECISCGYKDNADRNAALNIKNRVAEDVLRSKLLKENKFQELEPRKMKKEEIKELLETHNYLGVYTSTDCSC